MRFFYLAALPLLAACAQGPQDGGFGGVQSLASDRGIAAVVWRRDAASDAAAKARVEEILASPLSPAGAVEIALLNNASVQATFEEVGLAHADVMAASRPHNPLFDGAVRFPENGGSVDIDIGIVANLLDLLLIPARTEAAKAGWMAARYSAAEAVVALVLDVKTAAADFDAARLMEQAAQEAAGAADAAFAYARTLREAGNLSERAVAGYDMAAAEAALAVDAQALKRRKAERKLRMLLGLRDEQALWWKPVLREAAPVKFDQQTASRLVTAALQDRLDLAAQRMYIDRLAKKRGLTVKWAAFDTIDAGVAAERSDGWAIGPRLEIDLPVFHQGQAKVASLDAELRRAERLYEAAALKAAHDVAETLAAYEEADNRAAALQAQLLPRAKRYVELSVREANYMLLSPFEVLNARREEIAVRQALVAAQQERSSALLQLQRALGGKLPISINPTELDMNDMNDMEDEAMPSEHNHHMH